MSETGFEDFDEFMRRVVEQFPEAQVGEDNDGQLVIYTNLFVDQASQAIRSMEELIVGEGSALGVSVDPGGQF